MPADRITCGKIFKDLEPKVLQMRNYQILLMIR